MKLFYKSQTNSSSVLYDGNKFGHSQSRTIADLQNRSDIEAVDEITFINPKLSFRGSLKEKSQLLAEGLTSIRGKFSNLTSLRISGYDLSLTTPGTGALNLLIQFINQSPNLKNLTMENNKLGSWEIAVIEDWIFGENRKNPLSMAGPRSSTSIDVLNISGNKIEEPSLIILQNLKAKNPNLRIYTDFGKEIEIQSGETSESEIALEMQMEGEKFSEEKSEELKVNYTSKIQSLLEEIDRALESKPGEYRPKSETTLRENQHTASNIKGENGGRKL